MTQRQRARACQAVEVLFIVGVGDPYAFRLGNR